MSSVLSQFVELLVGAIQSLGTGIAAGVVNMAKALFLVETEGTITGLSIFGGLVAIFAGIALAVGITTRVYLWVTSLGK